MISHHFEPSGGSVPKHSGKFIAVPAEPDSANHFGVGGQGDKVIVNFPIPRPMTRGQALNLAAWLVAIADGQDKFQQTLAEIKKT